MDWLAIGWPFALRGTSEFFPAEDGNHPMIAAAPRPQTSTIATAATRINGWSAGFETGVSGVFICDLFIGCFFTGVPAFDNVRHSRSRDMNRVSIVRKRMF
jgi:hypothetical protein